MKKNINKIKALVGDDPIALKILDKTCTIYRNARYFVIALLTVVLLAAIGLFLREASPLELSILLAGVSVIKIYIMNLNSLLSFEEWSYIKRY